MSNNALGFCRKLTGLKNLELCNGQITDKGVRHLERLQGLTSLSLASNTHISDASVGVLANFSALRRLSLADSGLTGDGIQHLARIPVRYMLSTPLHINYLSCNIKASSMTHPAHPTSELS